MNEDVVNLFKSFGVGCRTPNDLLFRAGDEINKVHKVYSLISIDEEILCHKSDSVTCHVPGCLFTSDTIYKYDQHYNSCHRFSCSQCKKYFPSSHLLDLHLMEVHDAYFATLAEKTPMFQCYLKECKKVFETPQQRKEHGITDHKFPSNFRFDVVNSANNSRKKSKKTPGKTKKPEDVEMTENSEQIMEVETAKGTNVLNPKLKVHPLGNIKPGKLRKPVLDLGCFVRDLKNSLPSK